MNSKAIQRVLQTLRDTPGLSRQEIAERAFVGASTLSGGGYLKSMKAARLIHVSGWARNATGGFTTPLYSAGAGDDCAQPKVTTRTRAAPGMALLLDAIRDFGPIDYRRAAKIAGLSSSTAKNAGYLHALVAQRQIHIAEWRRGRRGPPCPLYEYGPGRDVPRPAPLSTAEISKISRWRKRTAAATHGLAGLIGIMKVGSDKTALDTRA